MKVKKNLLKQNAKTIPGDMRQRLLDAGLELFTQKGYAATTVREIVAAAQTTAPSLYYYFGNKEGLYLELMRAHLARIESLFEGSRDASQGFREQILRLCEDGFRQTIEEKGAFRLMMSIFYGPPQGAPFFDFVSYNVRFHELLTELLEKGIRAGEIQNRDPKEIAWLISGIMKMAADEQVSGADVGIGHQGLKRALALIFDLLRPLA